MLEVEVLSVAFYSLDFNENGQMDLDHSFFEKIHEPPFVYIHSVFFIFVAEVDADEFDDFSFKQGAALFVKTVGVFSEETVSVDVEFLSDPGLAIFGFVVVLSLTNRLPQSIL